MTPPPLRRNRDFQLLWAGQFVSTLGSRVSTVAFPLLVLAVTGSATKAGVTVFAETLPLMILMLPAGAVVDRYDRKRIMVLTDAVRALAMASIAAVVVLDSLTFPHLLAVAVVEGVGYAFFSVAERSALRQVVPATQLPAAIAQNQAREYAALLAGPPLGGVLFGLGRAVPFAADAASYAVSLLSVAAVRSRLQEERGDEARRPLVSEIREGLRFLFANPFLRTTSLLVTGSDLVINALFLGVIVLAEREGASSATIGVMLAFVGVGGLLGAAVASPLARRLPARRVVVGTMSLEAVLVPLIAVAPHPLAVGALFGSMFLLHPTWNAVVGAYRLRLTPDRLQGRVQSVASLLSLGAVPLGALGVGASMDAIGARETVLALAVLMAGIAVAAVLSASVRELPEPAGA